MLHFLNYFPCMYLKQRSMPFCAFFTTFTLVMTALILSTDLKGGRHYMPFNSSYIWEFEAISQESPKLSSLISRNYIQVPLPAKDIKRNYSLNPSAQIFNQFRKKRYGIFVECGWERGGDTEWLEEVLVWRGILTEPHPQEFSQLANAHRERSHLAQVCISPTLYPKHAFFRYNAGIIQYNETLAAIPCFPLYSLMMAYNSSHFDLLSLNAVTAPLQILRTLPIGRIRIGTISIKNAEIDGFDDICCDTDMMKLLSKWGYKTKNNCSKIQRRCYYVCSRAFCPSIVTVS